MWRVAALFLLLHLFTALGCEAKSEPAAQPPNGAFDAMEAAAEAETEAAQKADLRLLFLGNSHTTSHNLPGLVRDMIRAKQPGKTVYAKGLFVGFLDDAARDPNVRREIESGKWTAVILQAQKISMSGRANYSRAEGIDLAKRAKAQGARVCFFPEWGLQGKAGDGARQEKIYREMAKAAEVEVAPIAHAWDLALAARPDWKLHSPDGNHQSPLGAFLTASVLYGALTDANAADLADFPYAGASAKDRKALAAFAAQALKEKPPAKAEEK